MKQPIQGNFEGYIWWSNEREPKLCKACDTTVLELDDEKNPFIVEALLWDKARGKSISVRFVDGQYVVGEYAVAEEDFTNQERTTRKEFLALDTNKERATQGKFRLDGVSKLRFLQYWEAAKDGLCEGFETLQPGNLVFVGFEWKKAEEEQR